MRVDLAPGLRKLALFPDHAFPHTNPYKTMADKYYTVAAKSELETTPWLHVELGGEEILLCRDGEAYFAVSYFCSHEAFTLEGGSIENNCITCPYHGAEFNLRTGEALSAPAFEAIKTWSVRVDDETIAIGIAE